MKKFIVIVLFFVAMGYTIYNNHKVKQSHTITIHNIAGDRDSFIENAKKTSSVTKTNTDGSIELQLTDNQKRSWNKTMSSSLNTKKFLIVKESELNKINISDDYKHIDIRVRQSSLATLSLYLDQLVMSSEVLGQLEGDSGSIEVEVINIDNNKVLKATYPENKIDITSLM